MDAVSKSLYGNFMERVAGPVGSVLFHAALILVLFYLVSFVKTSPPHAPDLIAVVLETEEFVLDDLILEEFKPEDLPEVVETVDIPEFAVADMAPPQTDFAAEAPILGDVRELSLATDFTTPLVMAGLRSGQYANRSGKRRSSAMGAAGKWGWEAEAAVSRALEWLRLNQAKDGAWSDAGDGPYRVAFASLGLLTFFAHGETVQSERYGETVRRALRYLLAKQNERGEFSVTGGSGAYAQAMAVYAISEAYGMMRIPDLKPAMEKGVQVLIDGQHDGGGYDYGFAGSRFVREKYPHAEDSVRRDTSVCAWCCQAMKAAQIAGAGNPGLDEAMERAVGDLRRAFSRASGSFAYDGEVGQRGSGGTFNTTGMATLSLQLLGHGDDHEAKMGVQFLDRARCDWKSANSGWAMYGWYYITQVKFHAGGGTWAKWNAEFAPQFIRAQTVNDNPAENGSWRSPSQELGASEACDRAYSTTLAALTLQVYYRHLQTYKPIEKRSTADKPSEDDVRIVIM
jgi:hypothetical protein